MTAISHAITLTFRHQIHVTQNVFGANGLLADVLTDSSIVGGAADAVPRLVICVDKGVLTAKPGLVAEIDGWCERHRDRLNKLDDCLVLPGGEACKNTLQYVEAVWELIHRNQLCRHSYVVAVGGGAFLDMVGFAAATAHRGLRLVRLPTTSLAQGDGGVGVKNAINWFGKKNWVGTFQVPHAVINDTDFLALQPEAQRREGLVEALKVALIRDASLYDAMSARQTELAQLETEAVARTLVESARLHALHIATNGDPFELGSARPLDFGHWVAHKLEQMTDFRLSHGEAVSIGMAVDILYGGLAGLMPMAKAVEVLTLMEKLKFPLYDAALDQQAEGQRVVLKGLEEFREHLGGELTITLLTGIGSCQDVHTMDVAQVEAAISILQLESWRP